MIHYPGLTYFLISVFFRLSRIILLVMLAKVNDSSVPGVRKVFITGRNNISESWANRREEVVKSICNIKVMSKYLPIAYKVIWNIFLMYLYIVLQLKNIFAKMQFACMVKI